LMSVTETLEQRIIHEPSGYVPIAGGRGQEGCWPMIATCQILGAVQPTRFMSTS
jgi:hypothetical protein